MSQGSSDTPTAVEADDGVGKQKKPFWHPSGAQGIVLQLGALAGALLSIVAVAKLVLPTHHGPKTPAATKTSQGMKLALAGEAVHTTTLRDYLKSIGDNPPSKPSPELDARGFSAPYSLDVHGYPIGSKAHVRFEVWRETASGERYAVPPRWDQVTIKRDPDTCTCISTFINLPRGGGRYRLVIGAFPPGVDERNPGSPLKTVDTMFRDPG
ncbi:MAG TPA: hypothetical protein VGQ38_00915 [Gaiellaceae bacterium]|nr:hypothetical protein [Gaiellaceae bacterium]